MKGAFGPGPVLLSLALAAGVGGVVVSTLGGDAGVLRGLAAGLVLGWAGSALELRWVLPHLRTDFGRAMRIVSAGFGLRVLAILLGMIGLEKYGIADGTAFALGVVGGFLAFLPVLARAARGGPRNGEARG